MIVLDKKYRILIIDDAVDMQLLLEFDLVKAGCEVFTTSSGQEGIDFFESQTVDLILLDLIMPGISGLETLSILKSMQVSQDIPVIMLSSSMEEDSIVKALDLGADDYVAKPYIARILLARIRTSLRAKENNIKLEKLAKTDYLTGINNKGNFVSESTKALSLASRSKREVVVAMLDIDFFKTINDEFGHHIGDLCIIAFTKCLAKNFRDYDILGRVGGEEFAICLPDSTIIGALNACERFRSDIETIRIPSEKDGKKVKMTVSAGISSTQSGSFDIVHLLKQADKGLYYAKQHGRNQVCNGDDLSVGHGSELDKQPVITIQAPTLKQDDIMCKDLPGISFVAGLNNVLGIESLYQEILIMFHTTHVDGSSALEKAIIDGNTQEAKQLTYKLKGDSKSIGAIKLSSISKELYLAITEERLIDLPILLPSLKDELNIVLRGINNNILDRTNTKNV